ncbi:hypothetical protein FGIG_01596 [Fasciola gigantica]|uniref:Uncharacterized protein n=1 Tax=Fasciola gigantica TaxID=46835 RepID=A0A504YGN0_FASGI|nr:hypothetical protein FGIG_01596 [Fasciola gigantica]
MNGSALQTTSATNEQSSAGAISTMSIHSPPVPTQSHTQTQASLINAASQSGQISSSNAAAAAAAVAASYQQAFLAAANAYPGQGPFATSQLTPLLFACTALASSTVTTLSSASNLVVSQTQTQPTQQPTATAYLSPMTTFMAAAAMQQYPNAVNMNRSTAGVPMSVGSLTAATAAGSYPQLSQNCSTSVTNHNLMNASLGDSLNSGAIQVPNSSLTQLGSQFVPLSDLTLLTQGNLAALAQASNSAQATNPTNTTLVGLNGATSVTISTEYSNGPLSGMLVSASPSTSSPSPSSLVNWELLWWLRQMVVLFYPLV